MVLINETVSKYLRHTKVSASLRQHTRKHKYCFRISQASKQINPLLIKEACLRKIDQYFNQTSDLDPPGV